MTFDPLKPGGFVEGERLLHTQMNQLNEDIVNAADAGAGGIYDPSAALSITKLQCPTVPATGNAVANMTYVDAEISALSDYVDTEVSTISDRLDTVTTTNDGAYVSSLVNLSTVSNFRLQALRYLNLWVGSFAIDVQITSATNCSLRLAIPTAANIASTSHVSGSAQVGLALVASVKGAGTNQMIIEFVATGTGPVSISGNFSYYQTP